MEGLSHTGRRPLPRSAATEADRVNQWVQWAWPLSEPVINQ